MDELTGRFCLLVCDGDVLEISDPYAPYLRYDVGSWQEAVEIFRLSFKQGFSVCIWPNDDQGGGGE